MKKCIQIILKHKWRKICLHFYVYNVHKCDNTVLYLFRLNIYKFINLWALSITFMSTSVFISLIMIDFVLFQTLTFQVKVTTEDGERSTSKTIVIEVQDINDNSPEFEYPVSFVTWQMVKIQSRKNIFKYLFILLCSHDNNWQFSETYFVHY